jgi:Response regulator containing a CheY-like receiver domain and an HTH DNA-binding domain
MMNLDQFFREFSVDQSETKPEAMAYNASVLDAITRASGQSFYVIDYHKRGFAYVASSPLFLCGRTPEEIMKKGYYFYEEVIPQEDLEMLLEISYKGFELFYRLPKESRINLIISYDFRLLQPNRQYLMVNQKVTPILLTASGEIWLSLCIVSLSSSEEPGNVFMRMDGDLHHFRYSFTGKDWHDEQIITLSEREKQILQLSAEGYANNEISKKLFIDISTVKFHKRNLFEKINVKNITEAIIFANNHWLL